MAIDKNDPEFIAAMEEATAALAAKNKEILGELKKLKNAGNSIDADAHQAALDKVEELEAALAKTSGLSKKEIDRLSKLAADKDQALSSYLVDAGISDALAKAGVAPELMVAAKAMFKTQATVQNEEGKYVAKIGEKALVEHITGWAASDEGKHFVRAPANAGGGATGGSMKQAGKKFSEMTSEEQVSLYRADKAAYEAAKKAG